MSRSPPISAEQPDWSRERKQAFAWDPPRALLASLRSYQRHERSNGLLSPILLRIAVLRHRFWSVMTGADIPLTCQIGGGLLIPHPNGIVLHPDARIGPNCLIFQQVTIGASDRGVPTVGGHVDIGAGAKLIGPICVGDHARIGANALIVFDVPPLVTVVAPKGERLPAHPHDAARSN
jgi:serine O-acetyltransferase